MDVTYVNKYKGISLIVLVITIIVLAILAATVIITITNSGLINSSRDSVAEYDLAQVRDMASLAWAEALVDNTVTTDVQYEAYVKGHLETNGVDITKYDITATESGFTVNNAAADTYEDLIITADMTGVTFTKANGDPGDLNNLETGDTVIYGDYMYVYNQRIEVGEATNMPVLYYFNDTSMNGWSCATTDNTKSEYGKIATTVLGMPVTNIDYLFVCIYGTGFLGAPIINAPVIPSPVTSLCVAFCYCQELTGTLKIYAENIDSYNGATWAFEGMGKSLTIQVPADSTTYNTLKYVESLDNITLETF